MASDMGYGKGEKIESWLDIIHRYRPVRMRISIWTTLELPQVNAKFFLSSELDGPSYFKLILDFLTYDMAFYANGCRHINNLKFTSEKQFRYCQEQLSVTVKAKKMRSTFQWRERKLFWPTLRYVKYGSPEVLQTEESGLKVFENVISLQILVVLIWNFEKLELSK